MPQVASHFDMTRLARYGLAVLATAAFAIRLAAAFVAAADENLKPFVAFGFTVIFPLLLLALILWLGPTRSREGVLMRVGAAVQLVLIVSVPPLALQLLLGLPVVFLLVELFETRSPAFLRGPITRMLVAC